MVARAELDPAGRTGTSNLRGGEGGVLAFRGIYFFLGQNIINFNLFQNYAKLNRLQVFIFILKLNFYLILLGKEEFRSCPGRVGQ